MDHHDHHDAADWVRTFWGQTFRWTTPPPLPLQSLTKDFRPNPPHRHTRDTPKPTSSRSDRPLTSPRDRIRASPGETK
eukprot:4270797-Prymnesium_polylepis.1